MAGGDCVSCTTYFEGTTIVHRLDPRARIGATFLFAVLVAFSGRFAVLGLGVGVGALAAWLAALPPRQLVRRLLRVNVFMVMVVLLLPTTTPGRPVFHVLSFPFSHEGLLQAVTITLKANAIVLVFTALLGTVELSALGHAFQQLRVPDKLTHLFLFTLRYLDVLHHEYADLLRAMRARGFRPRMNLHTYRTYGYLLAMLLVRSLQRAERIMAAMKCRGFTGRFHTCRLFAFTRRDAVFCVMWLTLLAGFVVME